MDSKEIFTDNTKIKKYLQCKDCVHWGNDNPFCNRFDKGCCYMFPYPESKPDYVFNGSKDCEYYEKKEEH